MEKDSTGYWILAGNLWNHHEFAKAGYAGVMEKMVAGWRQQAGTPARIDRLGLQPESFRSPGYPLFLALVSLGGRHPLAVLFVQSLLGAACAVFLILLASRVGIPAGAALAAGVLWALHPALAVYDNLFLSESLFNGLCLAALLCCASARTWRGVILAGVLLGAASLVRPPLGLLFLPAAAILCWRRQREVRVGLIVALVALLPVLGWSLRNYAEGEGLRPTTVGDYGFIFYTATCVVSESLGRECTRDWSDQIGALDARMRTRVELHSDPLPLARSLAFADIRARPVAWVRVQAKSLLKLVIAHSLEPLCRLLGIRYQPSGVFSRLVLREKVSSAAPPAWVVAAGLAWSVLNALLALAALAGLVSAFVRGERLLAMGLGVTLLLLSATVGAVGSERFRLPMLALLLLSAGLLSRTGHPEPFRQAKEAGVP